MKSHIPNLPVFAELDIQRRIVCCERDCWCFFARAAAVVEDALGELLACFGRVALFEGRRVPGCYAGWVAVVGRIAEGVGAEVVEFFAGVGVVNVLGRCG